MFVGSSKFILFSLLTNSLSSYAVNKDSKSLKFIIFLTFFSLINTIFLSVGTLTGDPRFNGFLAVSSS